MLWPTGVCKSQWWKHRLTMQAHAWVQLYQHQYHPRLISSVTFSFGIEGHFTVYIPFTVFADLSRIITDHSSPVDFITAIWQCVCNNTRKLSSCDRQILGGVWGREKSGERGLSPEEEHSVGMMDANVEILDPLCGDWTPDKWGCPPPPPPPPHPPI